MNKDITTFELAEVYEKQGYYNEALAIYYFLDDDQASSEVKAGLKRVKEKIKKKPLEPESPKKISKNIKVSLLFEKWVNMIILEQRLNQFKRMETRL
jgi:hypothetical protein